MNKAEKKVSAVYDKKAKNFRATDKRQRWDYLFSKFCSDHFLLSKIDLEGKTVLNIGCAPHPIDEILHARKCKRWVATDINQNVLNAAKKMAEEELSPKLFSRLSFEKADARKLPYEDKSFDVVLAFSTIEHIPDTGWKTALLEISRVLKPKGYAIITMPNKLNLAYWNWSRKQQKKGQAEFGYEVCVTPFGLKREMNKNSLTPIKFASNFIVSPSIWNSFLTIPFLSYFGFRMGYLARKK